MERSDDQTQNDPQPSLCDYRACQARIVALVTTVNVANAIGNHNAANEIHSTPVNHGTNGWLKNEFKNTSGKQADKKLVKECLTFSADGKRCGGGAATTPHPAQPGGTTARAAMLTTTQTRSSGFVISGQPTNVRAVDRGNGIAGISNGVTTSAIGNGKT